MLKFYSMITNPETNEEEIIECQYEETPEKLSLKEQLLKEINEYELYYISYTDRYYHTTREDRTEPIDLACAVFKDDQFVGCMIKDVFRSKEGKFTSTYRSEGCGYVSAEECVKIQKRDKSH